MILLKYLFRTNNTEEVEKRFKNAYVFEKPSGVKEEIRRIFDEENNFTIILHHIDNNADYLLKLLEDSTKTYKFVAHDEVGISEALRRRFDKEEILPDIDYKSEAVKFLSGQRKGRKVASISFYKELSYIIVKERKKGWQKKIEEIGKILNRIIRCEKIILWHEYYRMLCERV